MAKSPVVLILGYGPRIGYSVAQKFASNGYKVAVASRSVKKSENDAEYLHLQADFAHPDSIPSLFKSVKEELQTAPSVVIYNAAALTPPPKDGSVLDVSAEHFAADLNTNTTTPYVAAQQAVKGWETLPKDANKVFIYTGNVLNVSVIPIPMFLNLGVGKSASAYWIGSADTLLSKNGYR